MNTNIIHEWGHQVYIDNIIHFHSDKCVEWDYGNVYLFREPTTNYEEAKEGKGSFYKVPEW